jgi:hypothetical protein
MWMTFVLLALLVGVAGGAAAALLLKPKSGQSAAAASPSTTTATSTPTATATPTPTATLFSGSLRPLLVPAAAGAGSSTETGALSRQDVAHEFGNVDLAQRLLQVNGYTDGAYRNWAVGSQDVVVEIYRFDGAVGARAFAIFQDDQYLDNSDYVSHSPVQGVAGSGLFGRKTPDPDDGNKYTAFALAARGGITIWVGVRNSKQFDPSVAGKLLKQQYDRLPAA